MVPEAIVPLLWLYDSPRKSTICICMCCPHHKALQWVVANANGTKRLCTHQSTQIDVAPAYLHKAHVKCWLATLNAFWLSQTLTDCHTLSVDGTQIAILKEMHHEIFCSLRRYSHGDNVKCTRKDRWLGNQWDAPLQLWSTYIYKYISIYSIYSIYISI